MKDFKKLQEMDRRMRELAGLYAAEKKRADSLAEELRAIRNQKLATMYAAEKERADKLEAELRAIRENRAGDVVVAESETTTATCKESLQVGNAAKIREALKYLRDASREFCHLILNSKYNAIYDKYKYKEVSKIRDAIVNANITLSAPARNCDVGTEQEQQDRFREFCRHYESEGECGIGRYEAACPAFQGGRNPDCSLWWAQMPYEGVKE